MRKDPIDDDHDADTPANAWQQQQRVQSEIGEEIERRQEGDLLNSLFD